MLGCDPEADIGICKAATRLTLGMLCRGRERKANAAYRARETRFNQAMIPLYLSDADWGYGWVVIRGMMGISSAIQTIMERGQSDMGGTYLKWLCQKSPHYEQPRIDNSCQVPGSAILVRGRPYQNSYPAPLADFSSSLRNRMSSRGSGRKKRGDSKVPAEAVDF
ncbi:hypothetical protein BDN72DRAFT_604846 [Pluteus cervinus]|uniref:Uncharacterized protein n=1 Tax=Pluteus cervinus TaxID=181527 RepID=A0ACD3BAZ1_9AGAR|nr:hypothetical protein BDN72DRAFT_604846 [Pluteus cervinus]